MFDVWQAMFHAIRMIGRTGILEWSKHDHVLFVAIRGKDACWCNNVGQSFTPNTCILCIAMAKPRVDDSRRFFRALISFRKHAALRLLGGSTTIEVMERTRVKTRSWLLPYWLHNIVGFVYGLWCIILLLAAVDIMSGRKPPDLWTVWGKWQASRVTRYTLPVGSWLL